MGFTDLLVRYSVLSGMFVTSFLWRYAMLVYGLPLLLSFLYGYFYGNRLRHTDDGWLLRTIGPTVNAVAIFYVRCAVRELKMVTLVMDVEAKHTLHRIADKPQPGGVCFLGDSEFSCWHSLESDMRALVSDGCRLFNAGFGGSRTCDLLRHADTLCIAYQPKVVVLHCGGNDWDFWTGNGGWASLANEASHNLISLTKRLTEDHGVGKVLLLLTPRRMTYSDVKWEFLQEISQSFEDTFKDHPGVEIVSLRDEGIHHPRSHYRLDKSHLNAEGRKVEAGLLLPKLQAMLG
eukprot:TRINITY_DN27440_c0_g1_i1.p1 TRINITY_DN27440_c0_g1~~TRINITY_DN27440_c0_g1_i1.p1  ORF type:complete len:290 (-),score=44.21 TRINITY_DN27440_c0_g1_i1:266-1135(-)